MLKVHLVHIFQFFKDRNISERDRVHEMSIWKKVQKTFLYLKKKEKYVMVPSASHSPNKIYILKCQSIFTYFFKSVKWKQPLKRYF